MKNIKDRVIIACNNPIYSFSNNLTAFMRWVCTAKPYAVSINPTPHRLRLSASACILCAFLFIAIFLPPNAAADNYVVRFNGKHEQRTMETVNKEALELLQAAKVDSLIKQIRAALLDASRPPTTSWSTPGYAKDVQITASPLYIWTTPRYGIENYHNDTDIDASISIPGATSLQVTLEGATEPFVQWAGWGDYIEVNGQRFSGKLDKTLLIKGDRIEIRFFSDGSVTQKGVNVLVSSAEPLQPVEVNGLFEDLEVAHQYIASSLNDSTLGRDNGSAVAKLETLRKALQTIYNQIPQGLLPLNDFRHQLKTYLDRANALYELNKDGHVGSDILAMHQVQGVAAFMAHLTKQEFSYLSSQRTVEVYPLIDREDLPSISDEEVLLGHLTFLATQPNLASIPNSLKHSIYANLLPLIGDWDSQETTHWAEIKQRLRASYTKMHAAPHSNRRRHPMVAAVSNENEGEPSKQWNHYFDVFKKVEDITGALKDALMKKDPFVRLNPGSVQPGEDISFLINSDTSTLPILRLNNQPLTGAKLVYVKKQGNRNHWIAIYTRQQKDPNNVSFVAVQGNKTIGKLPVTFVTPDASQSTASCELLAGDSIDCEVSLKDEQGHAFNESNYDYYNNLRLQLISIKLPNDNVPIDQGQMLKVPFGLAGHHLNKAAAVYVAPISGTFTLQVLLDNKPIGPDIAIEVSRGLKTEFMANKKTVEQNEARIFKFNKELSRLKGLEPHMSLYILNRQGPVYGLKYTRLPDASFFRSSSGEYTASIAHGSLSYPSLLNQVPEETTTYIAKLGGIQLGDPVTVTTTIADASKSSFKRQGRGLVSENTQGRFEIKFTVDLSNQFDGDWGLSFDYSPHLKLYQQQQNGGDPVSVTFTRENANPNRYTATYTPKVHLDKSLMFYATLAGQPIGQKRHKDKDLVTIHFASVSASQSSVELEQQVGGKNTQELAFQVSLKDEQGQDYSSGSPIINENLRLIVKSIGISKNTSLALQTPATLPSKFACKSNLCTTKYDVGGYQFLEFATQLNGQTVGRSLSYQAPSYHSDSSGSTFKALQETPLISDGKINFELQLKGLYAGLKPADVIPHLKLYKQRCIHGGDNLDNCLATQGPVPQLLPVKGQSCGDQCHRYRFNYSRQAADNDGKKASFSVKFGELTLANDVQVTFAKVDASQSQSTWYDTDHRQLHSSSDQSHPMTAGQPIHVEVELKDALSEYYQHQDYSKDLKLVQVITFGQESSTKTLDHVFFEQIPGSPAHYAVTHYPEKSGDYTFYVTLEGQVIGGSHNDTIKNALTVKVKAAEIHVKRTDFWLIGAASAVDGEDKQLTFGLTPRDFYGNAKNTGDFENSPIHLLRARKGSVVYKPVYSFTQSGDNHYIGSSVPYRQDKVIRSGDVILVEYTEKRPGMWRYALGFSSKVLGESIDLTIDLTHPVEADLSALSSGDSGEDKAPSTIKLRANPQNQMKGDEGYIKFDETIVTKGEQSYLVTYIKSNFQDSLLDSTPLGDRHEGIKVVAISGDFGLSKGFPQNDFVISQPGVVSDIFRHSEDILVDEASVSESVSQRIRNKELGGRQHPGSIHFAWEKDITWEVIDQVVTDHIIQKKNNPAYTHKQQLHQALQTIKIKDTEGRGITSQFKLASAYGLDANACSLDRSTSEQMSYKLILAIDQKQDYTLIKRLSLNFVDMDDKTQAIAAMLQEIKILKDGSKQPTSSPVGIEQLGELLSQIISSSAEKTDLDLSWLAFVSTQKPKAQPSLYALEFHGNYPSYAYISPSQTIYLNPIATWQQQVTESKQHPILNTLGWITGWNAVFALTDVVNTGIHAVADQISPFTEERSSYLIGEDKRQALKDKLQRKQHQNGFIRGLYRNHFSAEKCTQALNAFYLKTDSVDQTNAQENKAWDYEKKDFWGQVILQVGLMGAGGVESVVADAMDSLKLALSAFEDLPRELAGLRSVIGLADLRLIGAEFDEGLGGSSGFGGPGGPGAPGDGFGGLGTKMKPWLHSEKDIAQLFTSSLRFMTTANSTTARFIIGRATHGIRSISMSVGGTLYLRSVATPAISETLLYQLHANRLPNHSADSADSAGYFEYPLGDIPQQNAICNSALAETSPCPAMIQKTQKMLQGAGLSSEATLQGITERESGSVEGTIKLDSSSNNYLIERSDQRPGSRGRWMIQDVTAGGETQKAYIYQFKDSQRKILILQQADAQGYRRILFTDKSVNQALAGNANKLLRAIYGGDPNRITALLNGGANVNAIDDSGWTALMRAACFKHPDIASILLNRGANVNATDNHGTTALMLAAFFNHLDIVTILLDRRANVNATDGNGMTALMLAATHGNSDAVKALLDGGANIDAADYHGRTALNLVDSYEHPDMVSTLKATAELMRVVRHGFLDNINALLAKGANVNATDDYGRTALMLAVIRKSSDAVNALLDRGANIDAADKTGTTALMWAVEHGNLNMVKALLDRGANVGVTKIQGWTALMSAVHRGDLEVVNLLLDRGADINVTTLGGKTALDLAVHYNEQRPDNPNKTWLPGERWMAEERLRQLISPKYPKIIDILLKREQANTQLLAAAHGGDLKKVKASLDKGANVNAADKDGWTALMLAVVSGNSDVVNTLLAKGANIDAADNHGWTALRLAARYKYLDIENTLKATAKLMLVAKATAELMLAVKNGDLNKVNTLLADRGANVNATDGTGTTALILAAKHGNSDIVNALLDIGANIDAADYRGRTALALAVLFKHPSAVSALLGNLGRESSKEISIEEKINDIPLNKRFYLERIDNSQMLLAVRWEQGEPVMYLYPDQASLPKGVIIEHLDSRESCTVGKQATFKIGGIYSLADQDACSICHEEAVNIIPCSQSDSKHNICCIDCVGALDRFEGWGGLCPSCRRDCWQDLKKHDLKKLRPKSIRIKQPIVDSLYLLLASLPAKNAELRKNSDGSIEYRIRTDKDQINSHSWHPIAFGLSADFQNWLQSLPEEALKSLLKNHPTQDPTAPFIDDQDIRDFVNRHIKRLPGDTPNIFISNDTGADAPRDRLILSSINMDQFGQEPSNWEKAAAARQQAIVTIRGQINKSNLNDEELIIYIRSTKVWSYIPDTVRNPFNHKAGGVSAGDRKILAENHIPTEWFENNNQPFTYAQVRQRLKWDTLETWLQDRGNLTAVQANALSHYSATSALAYDIADGLDNLVDQTGNLSIMLNDRNQHWLAVNVTRNDNTIYWQFGDSAYGNRSEATIQRAIKQAINIYNLRRREGNSQSGPEELVLGQRQPFNIRAEDTQDNAERVNECAVYAWVYLKNMRQGMSNSDAPAWLISEISQKIRKD